MFTNNVGIASIVTEIYFDWTPASVFARRRHITQTMPGSIFR